MTRVDLNDETLGAALRQLGLEPNRPVLILAGSAANFDERQGDRVTLLFEQVVAPVCRETGATVIYGGTRVGVMALLGEAMADFAPDCVLLGVAPKALVPFGSEPKAQGSEEPDPHHSHFLRTPGDCWGDESGPLVGVAERIACKGDIVVLAIAGGDGTARELDLAAERGWPVLLATGCGGKVDEAAAILDLTSNPHSTLFPMLQVAGSNGLVTCIPVSDRHATRRVLLWRLASAGVLRAGWLRFFAMDQRASDDKPVDRQTKFVVLGLGVLATLAAILAILVTATPWHLAILGVVTVAPLVASVLLVMQGRNVRGSRWLSYRSAAEAIRREVYRYRTNAGTYAAGLASSQQRLAIALGAIDQHVDGRSAILSGSVAGDVWPPELGGDTVHPRDALLDHLDGDQYVSVRVLHQLAYYSRRLSAADRLVAKLLPIAFVAAVVATILAALGYRFNGIEIWVALATSASAAVFAWLDYDQTEQRAHSMASGAAAVRAAYERWLALPADGRADPGAVANLANDVEDALGAEAADWNRALRQAERSFHP